MVKLPIAPSANDRGYSVLPRRNTQNLDGEKDGARVRRPCGSQPSASETSRPVPANFPFGDFHGSSRWLLLTFFIANRVRWAICRSPKRARDLAIAFAFSASRSRGGACCVTSEWSSASRETAATFSTARLEDGFGSSSMEQCNRSPCARIARQRRRFPRSSRAVRSYATF